MKIKKVVFTWKSTFKSPDMLGNMQRLDIIFEENLENPIIVIDTGGVKIEDRTLAINNKEILNKIREIDFDKQYDVNCPNSYSGDFWELEVDDKKYQGILEDPHYVVKLKKIIRFNAIQVYANKKLAGYIKS